MRNQRKLFVVRIRPTKLVSGRLRNLVTDDYVATDACFATDDDYFEAKKILYQCKR